MYDIMDTLPDRDDVDFVDLTICLQLACGGRVSEILSFAEFKASPEKHHIIQTGILKVKHGHKLQNQSLYTVWISFLS